MSVWIGIWYEFVAYVKQEKQTTISEKLIIYMKYSVHYNGKEKREVKG